MLIRYWLYHNKVTSSLTTNQRLGESDTTVNIFGSFKSVKLYRRDSWVNSLSSEGGLVLNLHQLNLSSTADLKFFCEKFKNVINT